MADLKVYLFGAPRLTQGDVPVETGRRKATTVLAYLVLTRQIQRREQLATFFWPEHSPGEGRANLSRMLSALRKTLGEAWLVSDRQTVGLDPEADVWVDVLEFRRLLGQVQSHHHPVESVCETCLSALATASGLYQGDFMAGLTLTDSPEFDDWQVWQTERSATRVSCGFGPIG